MDTRNGLKGAKTARIKAKKVAAAKTSLNGFTSFNTRRSTPTFGFGLTFLLFTANS